MSIGQERWGKQGFMGTNIKVVHYTIRIVLEPCLVSGTEGDWTNFWTKLVKSSVW